MNTKHLHIPFYIICGLFAFNYGGNFEGLSADEKNFHERKIDMQGHRGARGLYPENTWPSIKSAIDFRMNTIEVDFHLTADERFIAHHDGSLQLKNCRWAPEMNAMNRSIDQLSLPTLKKLDCGYGDTKRFPRLRHIRDTKLLTLEEIADRIFAYQKKRGQAIGLNIEIKINKPSQIRRNAERLNAILIKKELLNIARVQSFNIQFLRSLKNLNQKVKTIAVFGASTRLHVNKIVHLAQTVGAQAINVHYSLVNDYMIKQAHKRQIQVLVWTVNSPSKMNQLLQKGVDGIISDYPDLLYHTVLGWKRQQRKKNKV